MGPKLGKLKIESASREDPADLQRFSLRCGHISPNLTDLAVYLMHADQHCVDSLAMLIDTLPKLGSFVAGPFDDTDITPLLARLSMQPLLRTLIDHYWQRHGSRRMDRDLTAFIVRPTHSPRSVGSTGSDIDPAVRGDRGQRKVKENIRSDGGRRTCPAGDIPPFTASHGSPDTHLLDQPQNQSPMDPSSRSPPPRELHGDARPLHSLGRPDLPGE